MKTFKLISLQMLVDTKKYVDISLTDGLIINKEDDSGSWIIEAFIEEESFRSFEPYLVNQGEVYIQAIITKKDNDPAFFKTNLHTIKKVDGHTIILFVGQLQRSRSMYAELLLEDLIHKGAVGTELLEQFKEKIRTRPKLTPIKND